MPIPPLTEQDPYAPLFEPLGRLRRSWPAGGWSWDNRFACISSSFPSDVVKEARAAIAQAFTAEWSDATIVNGPPVIQKISQSTGGIRAGQLLMTHEALRGLITYGLWWPWARSDTLSFRIGFAGAGVSEKLQGKLRDAFNAIW